MKRFFSFLLVTGLFFSCSKNNDLCNYDPCAVSAPASEITQLESYLSTSGITATKHCSGMYYSIETAGSGATATICSTISVKYKATLTNGTVFDQATTPASFQLGGLIESWKKGIPLIKTGGKIKLYCPPFLGYGSEDAKDTSGNVIVPGKSILIFEVELAGVS